jgi:transcriptional regulator with XRE-family HTH domain
MDFALIVRRRLEELKLEQRDLAIAAGVTESYISQLLTGKKAPPGPQRSDIYGRMGKFLKLPNDELSRLVDLQRRERLKHLLQGPPEPLFKEVRELIVRKCIASRQKQVRAIFERHPFGELEHLVTQKHLELAKKVAKEKLEDEEWLRLVARLSMRSRDEVRSLCRECVNAEVCHASIKSCVPFLELLLESWDMDLATFEMEVVLNRKLVPQNRKRYEFIEREVEPRFGEEPGLKKFLRDASLSGDATAQEIEFLKRLRCPGRQPTPLYYYRELQNLRDPLHFVPERT